MRRPPSCYAARVLRDALLYGGAAVVTVLWLGYAAIVWREWGLFPVMLYVLAPACVGGPLLLWGFHWQAARLRRRLLDEEFRD
jgi:hypothetical protein